MRVNKRAEVQRDGKWEEECVMGPVRVPQVSTQVLGGPVPQGTSVQPDDYFPQQESLAALDSGWWMEQALSATLAACQLWKAAADC